MQQVKLIIQDVHGRQIGHTEPYVRPSLAQGRNVSPELARTKSPRGNDIAWTASKSKVFPGGRLVGK